jgi:dTDP-4-dehydrorhamnose 3,5-epimerase
MAMLPGVRVHDLKKLPDERGYFCEAMRADWPELLEGDSIVQTNLSMSYPGMIRAWHRHARGQVDYFVLLKGSMKICAYDDEPGSPTRGQLDEVVASAERLQVVRIPGKYWHGTKTVSSGPSLTMYMVSRMYDVAHPDEERRPWNDPTVIHPRTRAAFDWNAAPHK